MRYNSFPSWPRAIVHSAPDSDRAGQDGQVAEIVTFRLADGTDEAAFRNAADAMTPFLDNTGAVIARTLSKGQDGMWTDHITWTSLSAAKAAAEAMMQNPAAGPFMSMIDPESAVMRHEHISLHQR